MIGSHADSMIADAWVKGIRGFDLELAYEATRHNALDPPEGDREKRWEDRALWTSVESRGGLSWYLDLGYVPADKTAESVSRTLEFAYDDFCVAQLAKAAGRMDDYETLMEHSRNYQNLYNPETEKVPVPQKYTPNARQPARSHRGPGNAFSPVP